MEPRVKSSYSFTSGAKRRKAALTRLLKVLLKLSLRFQRERPLAPDTQREPRSGLWLNKFLPAANRTFPNRSLPTKVPALAAQHIRFTTESNGLSAGFSRFDAGSGWSISFLFSSAGFQHSTARQFQLISSRARASL